MKEHIHEEFIRYDGKFDKTALDFYGPFSPLGEDEQKEFLRKYYAHLKKQYGESTVSEKAVTAEEAKEKAAELFAGKERPEFDVYTRRMPCRYRGWQLYTERTTVSDGTVYFSDDGRIPVPCAKFEYESPLKKIVFSVRIGKEYFRSVPEGLMPTLTGRTVEFRKGCRDILKLFFAPDGSLCYKNGAKKPYHYETYRLGTYRFDTWNDIEIDFYEEHFCLRFAGEEHCLGYSSSEKADTMFLGGGMQPVGGWAFRPLLWEDEKGEQRLFSPETDETDAAETYLGKTTLPFGIGTQKNRDRLLILRRKFAAAVGQSVAVSVSALDPGGEIFFNGRSIFRVDGPEPFRVDLTPHLKEGENLLEIIVFPRAPEVLYSWHRHEDCYHAWYCGEISTEYFPAHGYAELSVTTERVSVEGIGFRVRVKAHGEVAGADYVLKLRRCYPDDGETVVLARGRMEENAFEEYFTQSACLWTPESPVLYEVCIEFYRDETLLWKGRAETGFRTICQRNGDILLNGKKIVLKGALNMQFLPPYEEIPVNHICPADWQIVQQVMALRKMNGNCLRQHQLGYGCNDERFAAVCDRLGVMLIWTTRLIDSAESMMWTQEWQQADAYKLQMRQVINHPSVIMWEGSNELHSDLDHIDRIYDSFVQTVKSEDTSRLICPVSHLYYGGGIYECGCKYYNTAGTADEGGTNAESSFGWRDENVVRSAHTYCLLLGYGSPWRNMAEQNWKWQAELFEDKQKAYLVSEFAVIGMQDPDTPEAKRFCNRNSYERGDEKAALGFYFAEDEWRLSQAFQALCADVDVRQLLKRGADGMLWCCLWGGANDAGYLKPVLDFYGYKKLAYNKLSEMFCEKIAFGAETDVLFCKDYEISPVVCGLSPGEKACLRVEIFNEDGQIVLTKEYHVRGDKGCVYPEKIKFPPLDDGYYALRYTLENEEG